MKNLVSRVLRRVRHQYYKTRHSRLEVGPGFSVTGKLIVRGPGRIIIGANCKFDDATGSPNVLWTHSPDAVIQIGDNCYINGAEITAQTAITIQRSCLIADCLIMDTDFHSVYADRKASGARTAAVEIGENVWVGKRAMILKGVSVGTNSVIGAGAVVRTSVPANVVVIGNPHQIAKHLPAANADTPE